MSGDKQDDPSARREEQRMNDASLDRDIAAAIAAMDRTGADAASLSQEEARILSLLGAAVVSCWNRLSRDVQRDLFEAANGVAGSGDAPQLRHQLALFLHDHHERTASALPRRESAAGEGAS